MDFIRLFTSCNGRIGGMPYFAGLVALNIVAFILSSVLTVVYGIRPGFDATSLLINLPFTLAYFCLAIKRAHDLGHSGYWLLAWIAAFAASVMLLAGGSVISLGNAGAGTPALVGGGLIMLAALYQLGIRLTFFAGEDTENEYGAPQGSASGYRTAPSTKSGQAGGTNWMDAALKSVEKEAVSRTMQPAAPRTPPAANGFGRRNTIPGAGR